MKIHLGMVRGNTGCGLLSSHLLGSVPSAISGRQVMSSSRQFMLANLTLPMY